MTHKHYDSAINRIFSKQNNITLLLQHYFVRIWLFPLIIGLVFLTLVFFRLHGSSIGIYNTFLYGETDDPDLLFVEPRLVRSDEWLGGVNYSSAQYYNDFKPVNPFIGEGQQMSIVHDAPTTHWSTVFKPYSWGFFVFSFDRGFAFKWWYHGMVLIVGLYLFLYTISRNSLISALFSIGVFFTPFHRWWHGMSIDGGIGYMAILLTLFILLVHEKKVWKSVLYVLAAAYFSICFVLMLYPPFQIGLIYFGILFIIGYLLNNKELLSKQLFVRLFAGLGGVIMLSVLFILAYYVDLKEYISLITNTVYPGSRIFLGGMFQFGLFINGFYNSQLQFISNVPPLFLNQSEGSSYFMYFVFFLPVVLYILCKDLLHKKKIDWIVLLLSCYLIVCFAWLFLPFPEFIAKLTLFSVIPEKRIIFTIGFVNYFLLFYILYWKRLEQLEDRQLRAIFIAIIAAGAVGIIGMQYKNFLSGFIIKPWIIPVMSLASGILMYAVFTHRRLLAVSIFCLISIYAGYKVNPLYQGTAPLNSDLTRAVKEIQSQGNPEDRWVVYHHGVWGNYLSGIGIPTINGMHVYPHFEIWKEFDPQGKYRDDYNRYANVLFSHDATTEATFVRSEGQNDSFSVLVSPCSTAFDRLQVRYVLTVHHTIGESCLKLVRELSFPTNIFYIYERVSENKNSSEKRTP